MRAHPSTPTIALQADGMSAIVRAARFVRDRFLLLPAGAAIALVWANLDGASYFPFAQRLAFPVNEIAMALFLALVAQEALEALMPGGVLHTWRRWGLAIVAAGGGLAGAVLGYRSFIAATDEQVLLSAWPIAAAIDVAAGYYVLKLISPRSALAPLLLVIALVTNAVLVLLAPRPLFVQSAGSGIVFLAGALAGAAALRAMRAPLLAFFVTAGPLAWYGFYLEGLHPALALVPLVPFFPREPRPVNPFADPADDSAVHHFEHRWNGAVQVVLFFFGLVNAGIALRGIDTGTWAVLAAAIAGRPAGILLATAAAVLVGLHLPPRVGWREVIVVALASSSGFTFALFFATSVLPPGAVLTQIKAGALLTATGALMTLAMAGLLGVGRRARARRARAGQVIL
jgi:NhaA family Na+:H+ antiporter